MKRNLLVLIMCALGLFGNLRAQVTVTIGDDDENTNNACSLADNWDGHGASQLIYTRDEISAADGFAGTIKSIAFYKYRGDDYYRTWSVYLNNTNEDAFNGTTTKEPGTLVYDNKTFPTTSGWVTLDISDFEYSGENLLVTVIDNSGVKANGSSEHFWRYTAGKSGLCLTKYAQETISVPTSSDSWSSFSAGRFDIRLIMEGEVPLSATVSSEKDFIYSDESVQLTASAKGGSGSYTYRWSPSTGLDNASSATPIFTPTAAGEYTFTCVVSDGTRV